jgi:hypothetical protein
MDTGLAGAGRHRDQSRLSADVGRAKIGPRLDDRSALMLPQLGDSPISHETVRLNRLRRLRDTE